MSTNLWVALVGGMVQWSPGYFCKPDGFSSDSSGRGRCQSTMEMEVFVYLSDGVGISTLWAPLKQSHKHPRGRRQWSAQLSVRVLIQSWPAQELAAEAEERWKSGFHLRTLWRRWRHQWQRAGPMVEVEGLVAPAMQNCTSSYSGILRCFVVSCTVYYRNIRIGLSQGWDTVGKMGYLNRQKLFYQLRDIRTLCTMWPMYV